MAVEISRVFVSMRRFILENGDVIQRVAELQSRQNSFLTYNLSLFFLLTQILLNVGIGPCQQGVFQR